MDFLMFSQNTLPNNWRPFVTTDGVYFTCNTNRRFLCLTYLFIGFLSPYSSWGRATQTRPGGRKDYPSKTSSTPHYPFHPQREDTNRKKGLIPCPGTNVANNSSVEWNADAWSRRNADNRSRKEMLCWLEKWTEKLKQQTQLLNFSDNHAVRQRAVLVNRHSLAFPLKQNNRWTHFSLAAN